MDIPFVILAMYNAIALLIGVIGIVMGIKKIAGSPFITVVAGFLFLLQIILIDNVTIGYTEERSILTETITLAGQEASSFTTTHMNVTTSDSFRAIDSNGGTRFAGEEVTGSSSLVGDTFNRISVHIYKQGSPTGNAVLAVYDSTVTPTNANYLTLIATIDSATLTTTPTLYTYNFAGHTLASNQAIGIFYNSGSGANHVRWSLNTANPFDGTNSRETQFTTVYADNTGFDLRMALSNVVETEAEDTQEINTHDTVGNTPIDYAFNQYDIWVFTIVLGLLFIFIGIMLQYTDWSKVK